jgi:hypothetical protein
VAVAEWHTARGVTSRVVEKECWDLGDRVGVPPAPGLLCLRTSSRPSRVQGRIYRLEGKTLHLAWQGPVATWTNWLDLTPVLSDDGATLTVRERRSGDCEAAMEEYRAKEGAGIPMDWGPVLREGCASRGIYRYDGKAYAKDRGTTGAPAR